MMARILGGTLIAGAGFGLLPSPALAQISPGKLSLPHKDLEGSTQCLKCHDASQGVSAEKCLACHKPLKLRIEAGKGLHARSEYRDCKTCHIEHQGLEYALVWWGKAGREAFDHQQAGYPLAGAHAKLACEKCHSKPPTYLGLASACAACHADEHRGQFGQRECAACHDETKWKPAPRFDHAKTSYPLSGRHAEVACEKCHASTSDAAAPGKAFRKYQGTARDCAGCHQDVHRGRFGASCTTCHTTAGWNSTTIPKGFDHDRTAYPLRGRHAALVCEKCHAPGKPLKMSHERCVDCHADAHAGQLAGRADKGRCESCHDVSGFSPARFAVEDHKQSYPLTGAHLAVPCDACHRPFTPAASRRAIARYRFASTRCAECHRDPHRGELDAYMKLQSCEVCHTTASWRQFSFDHARTRFKLEGGHAKSQCRDCHKRVEVGTPRERVQLGGLSLACESCHRDTHRGQFGRAAAALACDRCHAPDSVAATRFDHQRDSAWPLDGAHAKVACIACHRKERDSAGEFVRYKPLGTACKDCHAAKPTGGKP